jgi:Ser/Thr protein kinase RdoA (MazF antagonist)
MSGPTDADVRLVLGRFRIGSAVVEPLENAGGFSGARIWRVRTDYREFCLKRWPAMEPDRHREIMRLIRSAVRGGLSFVPAYTPAEAGRDHVLFDGRLWDLANWMPGRADYHSTPSLSKLRAACVALARLHRVWERFAGPLRPCPAVRRRRTAAEEWLDLVAEGFRLDGADADPVTPWAERAWQIVVGRGPRVLDSVAACDLPLPVQPCHCDIWHDHVLFTGEEVTGLIDYGAVKPDNVAADLARMLGSFVGDDRTLWEVGLDAYAEVRSLSDPERQLAPMLDQTGVVLGLANWLRWLYRDGREFADRMAVAKRLSELVLRAEKLASVEE